MRRPGRGRATQGAALGTRRRGWGPARLGWAGLGEEDGSLETRQSKGRGGHGDAAQRPSAAAPAVPGCERADKLGFKRTLHKPHLSRGSESGRRRWGVRGAGRALRRERVLSSVSGET